MWRWNSMGDPWENGRLQLNAIGGFVPLIGINIQMCQFFCSQLQKSKLTTYFPISLSAFRPTKRQQNPFSIYHWARSPTTISEACMLLFSKQLIIKKRDEFHNWYFSFLILHRRNIDTFYTVLKRLSSVFYNLNPKLLSHMIATPLSVR